MPYVVVVSNYIYIDWIMLWLYVYEIDAVCWTYVSFIYVQNFHTYIRLKDAGQNWYIMSHIHSSHI
jgi:hypothetical protein